MGRGHPLPFFKLMQNQDELLRMLERRRQEEAMRALQGGGTNVQTTIRDDQGNAEASWASPSPDQAQPGWMTQLLAAMTPGVSAADRAGQYLTGQPGMATNALDQVTNVAMQAAPYATPFGRVLGMFAPTANSRRLMQANDQLNAYMDQQNYNYGPPPGYGYTDHTSDAIIPPPPGSPPMTDYANMLSQRKQMIERRLGKPRSASKAFPQRTAPDMNNMTEFAPAELDMYSEGDYTIPRRRRE